jgi:hypothetical protein
MRASALALALLIATPALAQEAARPAQAPQGFVKALEAAGGLVVDIVPFWDRPRSQAPLPEVLDAVIADLAAARVSDPEWAKGAEDELRRLAAKLATLPAPPGQGQAIAILPPAAASVAPAPAPPRAFADRPVWPGAAAPEPPGQRPVTRETVFAAEAEQVAAPAPAAITTPATVTLASAPAALLAAPSLLGALDLGPFDNPDAAEAHWRTLSDRPALAGLSPRWRSGRLTAGPVGDRARASAACASLKPASCTPTVWAGEPLIPPGR